MSRSLTPPLRLQNLIGRRSPDLYGWLFRYCYRCDQIRWRRHRHQPLPAWVVLDLTRAAADEHRRRRAGDPR